MVEARGDVHSAPDSGLAELERALNTDDAAGARRLSKAAAQDADSDDALALLATFGAHSPLAAELLIEALDASGTVRRFAQASLLDHAAVDDVSQDALISVADSIGSYDGRARVTTWVHSIVRRRVIDHLRRQRATAPLTDDDGPAARISSMVATRTTVHRALEALPERCRTPVILRDIEGRPYSEIAQQLGRAEGTVKAQISRGRAMVAARLGDSDAGAVR